MSAPQGETPERSQSKLSRSSKASSKSKRRQKFEGQPPPSRRRTDQGPAPSRRSLPQRSQTGPPGFEEPPEIQDTPVERLPAAPSSLAKGGKALPSRRRTHIGYPAQDSHAGNHSRAQTLPPMHIPLSPSRLSTLSVPISQGYPGDNLPPERSNTHAGYAQSAASKKMPRSQSLPPIKSPRSDRSSRVSHMQPELDGQMTMPRSPSIISRGTLHDPELLGSHRYLNQIVDAATDTAMQSDMLHKEMYFPSTSPTNKKEPLPEIQSNETKEPKHPRNIYINKKIKEMEALTKKLKEGPWADSDIPWEAPPDQKQITIEGPYTLDDVIYEEDEDPDNGDALNPRKAANPIVQPVETRKGFELPPAYDHETGEIKGEIAKAAAILASVTVDPTESKPAADPTLPNTCDCCADMNEHTKHLAALERDNPRPRVYQAKKLDEVLGPKPVEATGYYRSDSPVLIPVSSFMDRDLASEEMIKVGVAKEMVDRLKQIARPHDLSVSQVPWPFYAHDMATSNDLTQYLESGLPAATDALMQVNIGEANSKYKDSMDRLDRVMRKFRKY